MQFLIRQFLDKNIQLIFHNDFFCYCNNGQNGQAIICTGCYESPRNKFNHQYNIVKINIFLFIIFPQILQNRVKIKGNLNPKINTRSCVYTSIDNEAQKKLLDQTTYSNEKH
jgi:hypothetical protein